MSKGKFSNPRPYREEEREIEKSFRQLTGQEKPAKPDDPIFSEASVPDLDATDPEAAQPLAPAQEFTAQWASPALLRLTVDGNTADAALRSAGGGAA